MIKDLYIKGAAPSTSCSNLTWTRNPDWIALPTITSADDRFVGLFIVYEDGYNVAIMSITYAAANVDIDWGDGVIDNYTGTTSTNPSHTYDYTTLGGTISIDPYSGRNYKQVIIDLVVNSGTFTALQLITVTPINNGRDAGFLDISISLPNATTLNLSSPNKRLLSLERLAIYNNNVISPGSFTLSTQMPRLGEFIFEPILLTSLASEFPFVGCVNGFDIVAHSATCSANAWNGNYNVRRINNVSSTTINTALQMCTTARQLWYFGNLTLPLCTTLQSAWGSCDSLVRIGLIDTPIVTTIATAFNACYSLQSVEFTDLSLCTITAGAFNTCVSLEYAILPNLTVGFTVAGTKMGATALNAMFTSLGTAAGAQTIIVSNTPGAATCDTTIATAKGYTVTI